MTKEAMAAALHGNAKGQEISRVMATEARHAGLVVVYGASDDGLVLRGALEEEVDAWGGVTLLVTPEGLWDDTSCGEECPHFLHAKESATYEGNTLEALWCAEELYSWTYTTAIPHATFDVLEEGVPWCRGIVFRLADAGYRPGDAALAQQATP